MLVVADPKAMGAIEAPETAAIKLPIAIEQMRRGEIKTLQFILLSPSQFFEQRTTELGLTFCLHTSRMLVGSGFDCVIFGTPSGTTPKSDRIN